MTGGKVVRVQVDPDKCQGHNRCKALAPALFELDEYGNSREIGDGIVPEDQLEAAAPFAPLIEQGGAEDQREDRGERREEDVELHRQAIR